MEEVLSQLQDKWINIGLSTGKTDVEQSMKHINQIYANAGLSPPEFILTAKNPLDGVRMAAALQDLGYDRIKSSDNPQELVESIAKDIQTDFSEIYQSICFGNHDAANLAFYDYYINNTDISDLESVAPFIDLASVCGWWIPLDGAVVLIDRPTDIKFDENGVIHSQDGPAIAYGDSGFDVYVWHGTRIPPEWIRDKNLTAAEALTHPNMDQRRCACEILGWSTILKDLDCVIIDTHPNPIVGKLVEADIPDLGRERFLWAMCGTEREIAMPVPPDMETALEANAWTYQLAANECIPEVRT